MHAPTLRSSFRSTLLGLPLAAALVASGGIAPAIGGPAHASVTLKLIQWNNPPAVSAIAAINAAFEKQYPNSTVVI